MDIAVSMPHGMLLPDLHESIDASINAASKKKPAPILLPGFRFNSLCGHQTLLGIPHPAIAASRFKKAC